MCVYVWKCVCCCSQTEREVSNRDSRIVATLATWSLNLTPFQTPIATSDKSNDFLDKLERVSDRWYSRNGTRSARTQLFLCICSVQWASARSVKRYIIASLILHANIAEITAQELSLSCVHYLISSDNGSIKFEIRIFVQTSFLEGRAGYVFLNGCVSVIISYLSCWLTRETVKYIKQNSFIENLVALKYSMSTESQLDRTEQFFSVNNLL